jgi:hypothetical protein
MVTNKFIEIWARQSLSGQLVQNIQEKQLSMYPCFQNFRVHIQNQVTTIFKI